MRRRGPDSRWWCGGGAADIRNTRRIHRVIANGRVVDRAALLRRAEAFARR